MGIGDLLDTPPGGTPAPRLTPRAPLSVKELIVALALIAAVGAIYDRMNKYAEKSDVDRLKDAQTEMRIAAQHNFDMLNSKVDQLIKVQAAESDKRQTAEPRRK